MIYLTGDTHGDFRRIKQFCFKVTPSLDDTLIILGDASFNYYQCLLQQKAYTRQSLILTRFVPQVFQ